MIYWKRGCFEEFIGNMDNWEHLILEIFFGFEAIFLDSWKRDILEYLHIRNGNILEDILEIGICWRIF